MKINNYFYFLEKYAMDVLIGLAHEPETRWSVFKEWHSR